MTWQIAKLYDEKYCEVVGGLSMCQNLSVSGIVSIIRDAAELNLCYLSFNNVYELSI